MPVVIASFEGSHWQEARRIYLDGIATGNATFETGAPPWEDWDRAHLADPRLVALDGATVVGWAALSPVSDRCVYGGVAENSVYVAERARGRRVGQRLLEELIDRAEAAGIWTIQTGIFPRTRRASASTHDSDFVSSASASASGSSTAPGATSCSSSGAATSFSDAHTASVACRRAARGTGGRGGWARSPGATS